MRACLIFHVIVLLCAQSSSVSAQQQVIEWSTFPRTQDTESQRRQQRQQYLTELIKAIDEVLGLTDAHVRRLRVASKGAVEYSMEEERGQTLVWLQPIFGRAGHWRVRGGCGAQDAAVATRHLIWTKAIERMFTPEEFARVNSIERAQLKRLESRPMLREAAEGARQRLFIEQLFGAPRNQESESTKDAVGAVPAKNERMARSLLFIVRRTQHRGVTIVVNLNRAIRDPDARPRIQLGDILILHEKPAGKIDAVRERG